MTNDVSQLFEHHKKDPKNFTMEDVIGGIQVLAREYSAQGETEQARTLMDIAKQQQDMQKPKSSFMRPISKVSDKGNPLFFSAELGGYAEMDPQTGEAIPYSGQHFPPPSNPSAGAETELRVVIQQKGLLDEAMRVLTPDKLGVISKRWKTVGAYMDESTDPEAIYFRSLSELANTMIRHQYYGATLTNNEQQAFSQIATNRSLSPQAFKAQARAMSFAVDKVEDSIREASAEANRPFRRPGPGKSSNTKKALADKLGL